MNIEAMIEAVFNPGATTLLDIGSGMTVARQAFRSLTVVALDVYRPYLVRACDATTDNIFVNADARSIGKLFLENSFDIVSLLDVVEHFTKREAIRLVTEAEKIARMQTVLFVPRGIDRQTKDVFGMGGDRWQKHRSTWQPADLRAMGYKIIVIEKFHESKGLDAMLAHKES